MIGLGPKLRGLILAAPLIAAPLACGTFDRRHTRETDAAMAAMMGNGRDEVIAAWGLPAAIWDGENPGDRLMIYSNERVQISGGALGVPAGRAELLLGGAQTESKQVFRIFYLNPTGKVYRWAWRGCEGCDDCRGDSTVRPRPGAR
jgi:hypothetical protein